jgi:tetratricopeptide (TPR) repeat protein
MSQSEEKNLRDQLKRADKTGTRAQLGNALDHLAAHYHHKQKPSQALPLYRRSLVIWQELLGPEHPTVATLLLNLGSVYIELDDMTSATPIYSKALSIFESDGSLDNLSNLDSFESYLKVVQDKGQHRLFEQLEIRIRRLSQEFVHEQVYV